MSELRWVLEAVCPSMKWMSAVPASVIEQQHLKTRQPPIVNIVFAHGTPRELVEQVAEAARADGATDIKLLATRWPPAPAPPAAG